MKTYIVAVSGGVDSVVLLDKMARRGTNSEYIVAHVDHGIRSDSRDDAQFVETLAKNYDCEFVSTSLALGENASEEQARKARYAWLQDVQARYNAEAIVTAHHEDDVLETLCINLLRGTGWRGLCSLRDHASLRRPLLHLSKAEIVRYAIEHELVWRDDSTNQSPHYLRNYVRMLYIPKLSNEQRRQLVQLYASQCKIADDISPAITQALAASRAGQGLSRYFLIMAGYDVAREIVRAWVDSSFESKSMLRLWHFICTARIGKRLHENGRDFCVSRDELIVSPPHI